MNKQELYAHPVMLDALKMAAAKWKQRQQTAHTVSTLPIPRTRDELARAVYEISGIRLSPNAICPGHSAPLQAFADAFFATSSMSVWKGSRGLGGKTTMLALLGHIEMVLLGADVVILGGSGQQSQRVHEAQDRFWKYPKAPRGLLAREPTQYETDLTNGGHTVALMASTRSVRGPHPQRLRLDEVDEMTLQIFDSAMGQTMEANGIPPQTVMSSTHQYADGTMSEILKRAAQRAWPVYQWCYKENLEENGGWLPAREVDRKRNEVTKSMWDAEYDLQEPSLEGRAIDTKAVEAMFDPSLGEFDGSLGVEETYEAPTRVGEYATGADWAKDVDFTISVTVRSDVYPMRWVAFKRDGRRPWPLMIGDYNARVKKYVGSAMHDETGLGNVISDLLEVDAKGMQLVGRQRAELLNEYIKAIENGELIAPRTNWAYAEHRYATLNDLYGSGHLPDSICAGALAYRAAKLGAGSMW